MQASQLHDGMLVWVYIVRDECKSAKIAMVTDSQNNYLTFIKLVIYLFFLIFFLLFYTLFLFYCSLS